MIHVRRITQPNTCLKSYYNARALEHLILNISGVYSLNKMLSVLHHITYYYNAGTIGNIVSFAVNDASFCTYPGIYDRNNMLTVLNVNTNLYVNILSFRFLRIHRPGQDYPSVWDVMFMYWNNEHWIIPNYCV